jgi:hypothetical protein
VAKRKDGVAPPPKAGGWDFRFASNDASKGWDQLCATAASNSRRAWERITAEPRHRDQRQHPLKGSLGQRNVNGKNLDQWQYEITGARRIWYCIDDDTRTIWMTDASVGHPKTTE